MIMISPYSSFDELAKSKNPKNFFIPAKAEIQGFPVKKGSSLGDVSRLSSGRRLDPRARPGADPGFAGVGFDPS
jgi:hypothetical protein